MIEKLNDMDIFVTKSTLSRRVCGLTPAQSIRENRSVPHQAPTWKRKRNVSVFEKPMHDVECVVRLVTY